MPPPFRTTHASLTPFRVCSQWSSKTGRPFSHEDKELSVFLEIYRHLQRLRDVTLGFTGGPLQLYEELQIKCPALLASSALHYIMSVWLLVQAQANEAPWPQTVYSLHARANLFVGGGGTGSALAASPWVRLPWRSSRTE